MRACTNGSAQSASREVNGPDMDVLQIGHALSVWLLPVLTAITVHEAAHAWAAERLGDDTAKRLGRLTFNPIKHIDPFGTLLLPGMLLLLGAPFLIGYAKPVPVAFHRLGNPKRDMIWVAAAGPAVNIVMAIAAALLLHLTTALPSTLGAWIAENLVNAVQINIVLALFNMLPLPPLDGGRILTGVLPRPYDRQFASVERYGFLILIGVIFFVPMITESLGRPIYPLQTLLGPPYSFLVNAVARLAGLA